MLGALKGIYSKKGGGVVLSSSKRRETPSLEGVGGGEILFNQIIHPWLIA